MPVTIQPTTLKYKDGNTYVSADCLRGEPTDVQVNGTSVVSNGVANIPMASAYDYGVIKISPSYGHQLTSSGILTHKKALEYTLKNGVDVSDPVVAYNQHTATFYGLAKIAGADEKNSSLSAGTYTDNAKDKIQSMLGVNNMLAPHETDGEGASQAYSVGDLLTMNGKLYKVTSPIALNATITSGTNCTETKMSENLTVSGGLPTVTSSDNGKFLQVVNGAWEVVAIPDVTGVSF